MAYPNDSLGKPMVWIDVKCVMCKKYMCKMMTAEVVNIPMILCKVCLNTLNEEPL